MLVTPKVKAGRVNLLIYSQHSRPIRRESVDDSANVALRVPIRGVTHFLYIARREEYGMETDSGRSGLF